MSVSCGSSKQSREMKTELYFGLSNEQGTISDSVWVEFKKNNIDEILGGYTMINARGYWTSYSGKKVSEDSRVLILIHNDSEVTNRKIDSIINLYKSEFNQESVMKTQQKIKVEF
jgi:hypothetical protein